MPPRQGALRAAAGELARLVVPVACPGCGEPDVGLCPGCAGAFAGPRRVEQDAPRLDRMNGADPLPVWACAVYDGPVRDVVVAWKDRGRVDLTAFLVGVAHRAGRTLGRSLRQALGGDGTIALVPVPSSAAAVRSRGVDLVQSVSEGVAAGVRTRGLDVEVVAVLRQRRRVRDQVGLASRARATNLAGALVLRGAAPAAVLLVDDVLTTGATLAAAEAALVRSGAIVLGGVVLAATPAPGARHGHGDGDDGAPRRARDVRAASRPGKRDSVTTSEDIGVESRSGDGPVPRGTSTTVGPRREVVRP